MLDKLFQKQIEERAKEIVKEKEQQLQEERAFLREEGKRLYQLKLELDKREKEMKNNPKMVEKIKEIEKIVEVEKIVYKENFMRESSLKMREQNLEQKQNRLNQLETELNKQREELKQLDCELKERKDNIELNLTDSLLPLYLDDCGLNHRELFEFQYKTSNEYKDVIQKIEKDMKEMVKNKKACFCIQEWTTNNSVRLGRRLTNGTIKLALRLFNVETDAYLKSINAETNINNLENKVNKLVELIEKSLDVKGIKFSTQYVDSKIEIMKLTYEATLKKQQEKEELRQQMELVREQEKLEKEIAMEREKLEKEIMQYQTELNRLVATMNEETGEITEEVAERMEELECKISELEEQEINLEERIHNKAGWVYMITNNALDGVKIGVTRRLDPQDRIDELSSASVPFKFNTNCVVFSEDAFALENKLHKAFDDRRINRINKQKEFFNVTTQEVETYVKCHVDPTIEFKHDLFNEEYLLSVGVENL